MSEARADAPGGLVLPLPRLRPATAGDAGQIVRLLAEAATEGMLGLDPATLRPEEEAARLARLDLRRACALVVAVQGRIEGWAVGVRGEEAAISHTASVSLAVAAASRRRGLGRLLLGGVRAWAAAAGLRKLGAGVASANSGALALFHGCGYAVEGIRREQVCVGGHLRDEVLFGLLLPPAARSGQTAPVRLAPGDRRQRGPARGPAS